MATGFNTQTGNGEYHLQFETDNRDHYLLMQETARRCVDGKPFTNANRIQAMPDNEKREALIQYFSDWAGVGDSYIFDLTRVKEAFAIGTMDFDDFVEWDEERIAMLVDEFLEWLQKPAEV